MSKFKKKQGNTTPGISTASLPDIVFMLLFFFMVTTQLKKYDKKVEVTVPKVSETEKIQKKQHICYIFVGKAIDKSNGNDYRIQLNNDMGTINDIPAFIMQETAKYKIRPGEIMVSLKIDEEAPMGIVADVKYKLREAKALKIHYSTIKKDSKKL